MRGKYLPNEEVKGWSDYFFFPEVSTIISNSYAPFSTTFMIPFISKGFGDA